MPLATTSIAAQSPDPVALPLPPHERGSGFLSNVTKVFSGQIACALVALCIEICYARLLGPAGRGQVSLSMMIVALCAMFAGLGGEIPLTIWTASRRKNPNTWLAAVSLVGAVGSVLACFLWAVIYWWWRPVLLRGVTPSLAVLVLAAIPLAVVFTYQLALFTGLERFSLRAGVALLSQLAELAGIVVLVLLFGRRAEFAVTGYVLGLLAAGIIGAAFLRKRLPIAWNFPASFLEVRAVLHLGVRGLGNLASFFSYRLDVFVLNYFLDPAHVGWYALGVVISESLWQLPQAAATALFPRTVRTVEHDAAQFTCFVTRHCLLVACALGLLMALLSPVLIPLIFGTPFSPSVAVIWWILPGTIALSIGKVMSADITARGRPEFNSLVAITGGVVTVVLDFLLIPRMGINGAALASSITYLLEASMIAFTLKRFIHLDWRSLFLPTAQDLASYLAVWRRGSAYLKSQPHE